MNVKQREFRKPVTSTDVARLAGVSQSTVSRAFTASNKLSEATKERVFKAARELGYYPNAFARNLVSSHSNFIGIVKSTTTNPMFSELLTLLMERIQKSEYHVIYFEVGKGETVDDILPRILEFRVMGVILLYASLSSEITKVLRDLGIPVLQMQRYSTRAQANVVSPSNQSGAAMAVDHLWGKGYRNLAYITGEINSSSNLERQSGFLSRVTELGLIDPIVLQGDYTYESGCAAFRQLAEQAQRPCGVVCANDMMAMGVIDTARSMGFRVPQDFGVIGFDNNFMSNWPVYQLTSLEQPAEDLAQCGIDLLFKKIKKNDLTPESHQFDFHLVERQSTNLT